MEHLVVFKPTVVFYLTLEEFWFPCKHWSNFPFQIRIALLFYVVAVLYVSMFYHFFNLPLLTLNYTVKGGLHGPTDFLGARQEMSEKLPLTDNKWPLLGK